MTNSWYLHACCKIMFIYLLFSWPLFPCTKDLINGSLQCLPLVWSAPNQIIRSKAIKENCTARWFYKTFRYLIPLILTNKSQQTCIYKGVVKNLDQISCICYQCHLLPVSPIIIETHWKRTPWTAHQLFQFIPCFFFVSKLLCLLVGFCLTRFIVAW